MIDNPIQTPKKNMVLDKYKMLFNNIREAFACHRIILDENDNPIDYIFLEVNKAFQKFTGLNRNEIIGKKVTSVIPAIKDDNVNWIAIYGDVALNGNEKCFKSYSDALGKYYTVRAYSVGYGYFATIFHDDTEERKMEQQKLEIQKLESLGLLAGGIAHDFNNILSAILGNISLAKLEIEDLLNFNNCFELLELINETEKATIHAKSLTQQLMNFSKKGYPNKIPVDIRNMIVESSNFVLRGSDIKLVLNIERDLYNISADINQINQVITNLILNSRDAIKDGGKIEIDVRNADANEIGNKNMISGKFIEISISDDGIGMSDEVKTKIFQPYFTTKPDGNGLGLSFSKSIVKNHGGYIFFNSKEGEGTTFKIYLPKSEGKIKEEKEEKIINKISGGRILILEDDQLLCDILKKMITKLGFNCDITSHGQETIEVHRNYMKNGKKYLTILMDMTNREGMGAIATLNELKKIDSNIKAILTTGYSNDIRVTNYSDLGFSAVLLKPFTMKTLSDVINKVVLKDLEVINF